ncbi:MAG: hypothetical protein ABFS38_17375, partial [Bacteroidota bacterium]
SKFAVQKIVMKEKGVSTLGGRKIWFDEDVMRLNVDARGSFIGEFTGEDKILVITKSGKFRTTNFDLSNHFEDDLEIIEKFRDGKIWSAAYYDAEQKYYYLKRFLIEPGTKMTRFIGDHPDSRLIRITEVEYPRLELKFGGKNKDRGSEIIEVAEFIGIKSYKARGKRLSNYEVKVVEELEPLEKTVTQQEAAATEQTEPPAETADRGKVKEAPSTAKTPAKKRIEPEKKVPEKSVPEKSVPEKKTSKKRTPEKKAPEKIAPTKKAPEKKVSEKKAPEKATKEEKKSAGKPTKKVISKDPGKPKTKQDPNDVPMEVVKPKEEQKRDDPDDNSESNGQFSLDW